MSGPVRSLRLRLLGYAALTVGFALVLAWIALGLLFERHTERQLEAELRRHGSALAAALSLDPQGRPVIAAAPFDPRFARPAGGLYWRVSTPAGEVRSRSLWDGALAPGAGASVSDWKADTAAGPFEPRVIRVSRQVRPDARGPAALIEVAADHASVTRARRDFAGELGLFLALLWAVLTAAAWAQVRLGLQPLTQVRADLARLSADPDARLDPERHPSEIAPLAQAINSLADARAADLLRARDRARDLAHALKTPLTALRVRLGGAAAADVSDSLALLSSAIESELARAQVSAAPSGPASTEAAAVIERLVNVLVRTEQGARLTFDLDLPPGLTLPMREDAALEAFGALLENAVRYARARVAVSGGVIEGETRLTIADDGPGIPLEARPRAMTRGVRLDEAGPTHGLGLAIARDFIEASGGGLRLDGEPGEGLTVTAVWPASG